MKPASAHPNHETSRSAPASISSLFHGEPTAHNWFDGLPGLAFVGRADHARTLELINDGSHLLLGRASSEPFELAPLIHPDERDMVVEYASTAAAGLQPFAVEYRLRHARGHWLTVWEQSRPVRVGHQILLHGHLTDVSQRVQHERTKLAAEQELLLRQKTFALNKLAGGVAHEFNNIVAGILGSAELIALDVGEHHPAHDSLKQIFEASNRARDFVHKIRALAQRAPLERKLIPLAPVIEECLQILRSIIPDKVAITAHLAPGCPAIYGDAASLQQTLLDVCLYAWQGLPERRGQLMISLAHLPLGLSAHVSGARPGPHLCLTVRDNGPGLDKNAREKIFEPFHSRKSTGKQMGLEMFLARETVQAHQGEIIVETDDTHGTAFSIYLPVAGES